MQIVQDISVVKQKLLINSENFLKYDKRLGERYDAG